MALDQQNIPTIDIYPTPRPTIAEPGVEGAPVQREGVTERIVKADGPQVAGGTTQILKAILGAGSQAAPPPKINPDAVFQEQDGLLIFRDPTPDEVVAMNRPLVDGQPTTGQPGGNPDVAINLNRITGSNDILRLYSAFAGETTDLTRNTPVSFADILAEAENIPAIEMTQALLQMQPGTVLNAAQLQRSRQVVRALMQEADKWGQRALQTGDPKDLQQAMAYQVLTAGTFRSTVEAKTAVARALAALRDSVMFNTNAAADMEAWLNQARTINAAGEAFDPAAAEQMRRQVQLYMALPKDYQRAEFVRRSLFQTGSDLFMEHYINALLSAPPTHLINILGSMAHIGLATAERGVAGVVGAARTGLSRAPVIGRAFSNTERVYVGEMMGMLHGLWEGNRRGLRMAYQAFKTEEASDLRSKLELDDARRITVPETFGVNPASPIGKMIQYYGVMVRLPGRFIMAEDEYFKGLTGHMETQAQAYRRALDMQADGMSADDAAAAAVGMMMRGDGAMGEAAGDFGRQITFQDDLPRFFEGMYALQQHPLVRVYMPFFRTPVNVIKQVTYRTPGVNMPYLAAAIRKGGRDADIAIARTMTGASLIGGAAMLASEYGVVPGADIIITGQDPTDAATRQTWQRLGLQAYSFNRLKDDGGYESISYARLDPVSGVLAMGADMAHFSARDIDGQDPGELVAVALNSYLQYAQDLPMLTGMSEIMDAVSEADPDQRWRRLTEVLTRDLVGAIGTAVPGGPGAMTAAVERAINPAMNNTKANDPSQNPMARGFYEALQRLKARHPLFSDDVPPRLNFWGEEMKVSGSMAWRAISPFRINDGRFNDVDMELLALGKAPAPIPDSIDGIKLTADQQNQWIRLMNTVVPGSTVRGHRVRAAAGDEDTLLEVLQNLIYTKPYQDALAGERYELINQTVSQYRRAAKELLVQSNPDLGALMQQRELNIQYYNRPR